jgi:uncharacterized repeat protein (TIGR03803 family)
MGKLNWGKSAHGIFLLCLTTAIASPAQTVTILHSFDGADGATPLAGLVQATNGNLYGTTDAGGASDDGTVFKITPRGTLTMLHSFNFTDGFGSYGGLVQATNGNLYGTTPLGGSGCAGDGCGTVFKISARGTLTTLHSFDVTDSEYPYEGLVQASNGNLYGTTSGGFDGGDGTVYKMTPSGALTTLHSFNGTDGDIPLAVLTQHTNGNLYGTTEAGGTNGEGTVFKMTPSGKLTTLYSYCSQSNCTDGALPYAGLVQGANGNLYGTTYGGGTSGNGTVFEITPSGTLTTLYSFCSQTNCADGSGPEAALVRATDGNFYGTTPLGGSNCVNMGCGTVFRITPSGKLTTLYSFCSQSNCTDGAHPYAGLVQDTNGNLYGTTQAGGASGEGTVFSLSVGLGPFVETQTTSGKVGAAVKILGTNLTGATSVTFSGTAAIFKVVSGSLITTTVPVGATTGEVKVKTPRGSLKSNVVFRVEK